MSQAGECPGNHHNQSGHAPNNACEIGGIPFIPSLRNKGGE